MNVQIHDPQSVYVLVWTFLYCRIFIICKKDVKCSLNSSRPRWMSTDIVKNLIYIRNDLTKDVRFRLNRQSVPAFRIWLFKNISV